MAGRRRVLTGACPSPVTLTSARERPPVRAEILAQAQAELARHTIDPGGQVMQARFVLQWLAGDIDALPLWNGGPNDLNVSDSAPYSHRARSSPRVRVPRRCPTPRWLGWVPASADMPGVHRLVRPVAREREKATCGPHEKLALCFR
jgi:hypothetical protein